MKKIFITNIICENNKYYSYAETIMTGQNILPIIHRNKNLVTTHLCETKKQAERLAIYWNECYKKNGTNLF